MKHEDDWLEGLSNTLIQGFMAKFKQNPKCEQFLLETEEIIIGEATTDRVYGTGISIFDQDRFEVKKWKENKVGYALMEALKILEEDREVA